jgi:hypothetical protein
MATLPPVFCVTGDRVTTEKRRECGSGISSASGPGPAEVGGKIVGDGGLTPAWERWRIGEGQEEKGPALFEPAP